MGLDISSENKITLSDSHQKRVNTSLDDNPSNSKLNELQLIHLLKRIKSNDDDGDGNPLIYALKNMKGYSITAEETEKVFTIAQAILEKSVDRLDADYILPLPSNNNVCMKVAKLVSSVLNIDLIICDFIQKKTVGKMLEEYGTELPVDLDGSILKTYKSQLKSWRKMTPGQTVSMKDINVKIRKLFSPLEFTGDIPNLSGHRVILVDDLMSSGSSLISAKNLLLTIDCTTEYGVCLLSPL